MVWLVSILKWKLHTYKITKILELKNFGVQRLIFQFGQLISIYSLTIHTSLIKRWIVKLSVLCTSELSGMNISHVWSFKLFGNTNLQMIFSYANEVFMGMVSSLVSWNVLCLLAKPILATYMWWRTMPWANMGDFGILVMIHVWKPLKWKSYCMNFFIPILCCLRVCLCYNLGLGKCWPWFRLTFLNLISKCEFHTLWS
jgi:hypothetical protein